MTKTSDYLTSAAVLGAAGKMGSGISLLLLQEMARSEAKLTGKPGSGTYRLVLIDEIAPALDGLKKYLHSQLLRYAEKNIVSLRKDFANNPTLVSNEEIIDAFVQGAMDISHFGSSLEEAKDSSLIFEAIVEDVEIKSNVFRSIFQKCKKPPYFFTNTSSIPISVLNQKAGLQNRIIGYHFYNPPPVQKLLEIIPLDNGSDELTRIAIDLAKRLDKIVVESKDVAGFIGNGYFLREIAYAMTVVDQLRDRFTQLEAIYMVNKLTQEFLLRPMGIFQLLDYVGLDVAPLIGRIMNKYLNEEVYKGKLIEEMVQAGIKGGQYPDGSQKDGFFQYKDHRIAGIYDFEKRKYRSLSEGGWQARCDQALGPMPKEHAPWKVLSKDRNSQEKIQIYFEALCRENTLGAELALAFLHKSAEIANKLVEDGVAKSLDDVNTVLKNGFYHIYGVIDVSKKNLCRSRI